MKQGTVRSWRHSLFVVYGIMAIWQTLHFSDSSLKLNKPGEPISVTARELESFMLEHNAKFNSRDYDKFERMELMESPVCDAIHELKTHP